ncbi:unnamed protein product, partial [Staurois parvus]
PVSSTYQCQSVPPISGCPSLPPNSSSQCRLTVPCPSVNVCQCPPVMLVNAHQCHLPVLPHQCRLSVSISAAYQCPSLQPH